jgi:formate hydrogenlyase subunit 6/NADH:ubiquinone oxidoreductase subunit I
VLTGVVNAYATPTALTQYTNRPGERSNVSITVGAARTIADLTTFTYDLSRCMFCGLCEDACPVDALELTQDFELASYTREGGIWDRQMLEEGPRPIPYT